MPFYSDIFESQRACPYWEWNWNMYWQVVNHSDVDVPHFSVSLK